MRVFISADIEGIATTTIHEECNPSSPFYAKHAEEMTNEVLAACEGAFAAGATEVVVRDAHGPATNIDPTRIPENVVLNRGWSGHPYAMVEGVNSTFDAAMFIGYHSSAGRPGNPLSHTMTGRSAYIKINGRSASEFMIYSWACALEGVPTVLLSGDKMLCEEDGVLHPGLFTVPTKDGLGSLTCNYSTETVHKQIRERSAQALRQDLKAARIALPEKFQLEVFFKDQHHAEKVSHYPGIVKTGSNTITYETTKYLELLRALRFIL